MKNKFFSHGASKLQPGVKLLAQGHNLVYIPGFFFLLLGLAVVVAPRFVITVLAAILFLAGTFFLIAAYRLVRAIRALKGKMSSFQQGMGAGQVLQGQILVHMPQAEVLQQSEGEEPQVVDIKKIVLH